MSHWTLLYILYIIYNMLKSKIDIIKEAQNQYSKGNIEIAYNLVKGKEFDENIDALWVRESTIKSIGKETNRIKVLKKILKLQKNNGMAHFVLGNCYYREKKFDKSIKHFKEALKTYPKHPTILETLPLAIKKLKSEK